ALVVGIDLVEELVLPHLRAPAAEAGEDRDRHHRAHVHHDFLSLRRMRVRERRSEPVSSRLATRAARNTTPTPAARARTSTVPSTAIARASTMHTAMAPTTRTTVQRGRKAR